MKPATLLIVVMAMSFFLLVLGGGGYFLTREKDDEEGEECQGIDINAVYNYDENEDCSFTKCKDGYVRESGYCIQQRDYSSDNDAGSIPKNCEIGKYIEGQCVNPGNGRQLTGERGRCGTGVKTFTADPDSFTMANSLGSCDNYTYTEACEVPCDTVACNAKDENYTKTDGVCRGLDGNPLGGNTGNCGSGYQIYEVDPATAGSFSTDELRNAWVAKNWKDCTPLKKTCEVMCKPGMTRSGCPDLTKDIGAAYVQDVNGEKACLPKNIAIALLKGETRYDRVTMPMEKLSRASAELKGITSMADLPEGYSILYKSDAIDFRDYNLKGCATAQLESCRQPTKPDDCVTGANVVKVCYDVGCGQQKKKDINVVVEKDAWGSGSCVTSKLGTKTVDCSEDATPACCSSDNDSHWTEPLSYTCSTNGTYNLVNTNACSTLSMRNPPTRTKQCCYVGSWVKGQCNQDKVLDRVKYTRSVVNKDECTTKQLNEGVNDGDTFDEDNPTVKYVLDRVNCYSQCEFEEISDPGPPYRQKKTDGSPFEDPGNVSCSGTVTFKLTKAGKGSGLSHWSCLVHNAKNYNIGETFDGWKYIGKDCPSDCTSATVYCPGDPGY